MYDSRADAPPLKVAAAECGPRRRSAETNASQAGCRAADGDMLETPI